MTSVNVNYFQVLTKRSKSFTFNESGGRLQCGRQLKKHKYAVWCGALFLLLLLAASSSLAFAQTAFFSPNPLMFQNQAVGTTSDAKSIRVSNYSRVALSITSIVASGDFAVQSASTSCAGTLAAGEDCSVGVTFTPTSPGVIQGLLTFTDSAGNSPQIVRLSGLAYTASSADFVLTGTLNTRRYDHTATLLNNGMVLIAGGSSTRTGNDLASAELYNPATGTFTATGSMSTARSSHRATLLNNGMVLVTGGASLASSSAPVTLASAELYNPATGTFTPAGSMSTAREYHTVTVLNNGMVLIAGGCGSGASAGFLASAELYDPATGTFTPTGNLNTNRFKHTATLLNNGMVLMVGGASGGYLASAELYNPSTGTFAPTGSLATARDGHTATLLNNGMVLIAGGIVDVTPFVSESTASSELYNPATGTFTPTGNLNTDRFSHTATLLNNGMVLMVDGLSNAGIYVIPENANAEMYDPATGTYTPTVGMNIPRSHTTATLLNDGTVLVAGGSRDYSRYREDTLASAELYVPDSLTPEGLLSINVEPAPSMLSPGETQKFTAVGTFSDGSTHILQSVNWSSTSELIATITNDATNRGTAQVLNTGTTTIIAKAGNISGSAMLTVNGSTVNGSLLRLLPARLSFGTQLVGTTSSSRVVALRNRTAVPVAITGISITDDFTIQDHNCPAMLAAGADCTINVTFSPHSADSLRGTLTVTDSALNSPQTVSLAGNGKGARLTLSPDSLTFDRQIVGSTGSEQTATVTNTSNGNVTNLVVDVNGEFTQTNTCSRSLTSGASCVITVRFTPTSTGPLTGAVAVTDNADDSPYTLSLSGFAYDASSAGGFAYTGDLNTARFGNTATLLNNGMVLIAGGYGGSALNALASVELYNPATGIFTPTGSLNTARYEASATLLNNGMVLVVGGFGLHDIYTSPTPLASAELYDPATGTFTPAGSLNTPRTDHTATLLNNGMLLIAGGRSTATGNDLASAELYNPATGTFIATGSLNTARSTHSATLLGNGTVLIAGGNSILGAAELYNPATGTFTPTGTLNVPRVWTPRALLLNSGMVLIQGGSGDDSAELYNPATGAFTLTGSVSFRMDYTATLLRDGTVLIAGGFAKATSELYDPATGTFSSTGSLNTPRRIAFGTATLLNNGMALIVGGLGDDLSILSSAELYIPNSLAPPDLVSIDVSPASSTSCPGGTQKFTAIGTFSDGSTQILQPVNWSSTSELIATITNDATNRGTAQALNTGTTTIIANVGDFTGLSTLTVGGATACTSTPAVR